MADKEDQKENAPTDDHRKPHPKRGRRFWIIGGLVVLFVSVGLIYLGYWAFFARFNVGTDDAYVHGNQVAITPQVSGIVASVETDDTQFVQRGQVVVRLDQNDAQVALAQAEAQLGQNNLADSERRSASSHRYPQRSRNADRFRRSATSTQCRSADRQSPASLYRLGTNTVVAPVTGYVAQRTVQVGQQVAPGTALLAIVPEDQMWVEANYKETQLGSVRIGQPATVHSDFYKGAVEYRGRVVGILSGTGDVFQLLPPQNATGNWIKIVRRVPVRIALDQEQMRQHPLRLGLSVEASVDIHSANGPALAETPSQKPLYQTDVYAAQGSQVDSLIDKTIRENGGDQSPNAAPDSLSRAPDHGEQRQ